MLTKKQGSDNQFQGKLRTSYCYVDVSDLVLSYSITCSQCCIVRIFLELMYKSFRHEHFANSCVYLYIMNIFAKNPGLKIGHWSPWAVLSIQKVKICLQQYANNPMMIFLITKQKLKSTGYFVISATTYQTYTQCS